MYDGRYDGYSFAWPRLTPAVKLLLIINGAVFVVNALVQGSLIPLLGLSWDGLDDGFGLGVVRLLTYQFVHDFHDPWHVLLNMLLLYFFGTLVEGAIGRTRLLRLYLVAGVVGGIMQMLLSLVIGEGTGVPMVGASGAVYGILVYAAFMAPRMRVILIVFPIELRWLVGFMVGIGVYMTYIALVQRHMGGVAHGGHLGGALWGMLAYRLPAPRGRWRWWDRVQRWQRDREHRSRRQKQQILDELLEKVHREGIGSLTPAERRFLDRTSQELRRR